MTQSWAAASLNDVSLVFTDGDWIESKDQSPAGIRLVQTGNVGIGEFKDRAEKARYISNDTFQRLRCTEIFAGDCLISRLPDPVGRACLIPPSHERRITAVDCTIVRFDGRKMIPEFFKYFSQSAVYLAEVDAACTGATRKRISRNRLGGITIPVPTVQEQRRIVAILDEAFAGIDAAIANTEKNLANARELFDSYLTSVFSRTTKGWVTEQLGGIARFIDYRGNTPPKREAGIRLITARNVKMGYIQGSPEEFVDPAAYDRWMTRGFPKRGDVLFTTEAPLGNVAQLDTDETVIIGQRLITLQPDRGRVDRAFLKFALMSGPTQQEIRKRATGATVLGIKASLLKEVPISFPSALSEQAELAATIEAMSRASQQLELSYKRKIDTLGSLKQSFLRKAFAGELTANPEKLLQAAAD